MGTSALSRMSESMPRAYYCYHYLWLWYYQYYYYYRFFSFYGCSTTSIIKVLPLLLSLVLSSYDYSITSIITCMTRIINHNMIISISMSINILFIIIFIISIAINIKMLY